MGISLLACSDEQKVEFDPRFDQNVNDPISETPGNSHNAPFYYGADLSYVNEMEDCGAEYFDLNGEPKDPYVIFDEAGANLIRIRLWHSPTWTDYSTLEDVRKSIRRAKDLGMEVLLDFHYSDDWADPAKQEIPAAWEDQISNTPALADLLYDYTFETLASLASEGLLPELVQVGNEINGMILQKGKLQWPIDWDRNATLINHGIKAIRDISEQENQEIEVMLHVAQPENGLWWFEQATKNGVVDFDWIGLSYYPIWSEYTLENVRQPLEELISAYDKKLMIVETAYPFTLENKDHANNILNDQALINNFPASQEGQLAYLKQLEQEVTQAGGGGIVYWESAWVSTSCLTQWGKGSHWDNATLFDHGNQVNLGMQFYNPSN